MKKNILYKLTLIALFICANQLVCTSQVTITMRKEGGVYTVPCTVNGLKLRFIFDTGASDVSISMTEALFMLKNDYLNPDDIIGREYYSDATGYISEGTKIILRKIEFNGIILTNVEASVVHNLEAPLLLGQSAMAQIGKFQFDPNYGTITILNATYKEPNSSTYDPHKKQEVINYNKEYPCLSMSGTKSYTTKISIGTLLIDAPSNNGKKIKQLITGQSIDVINDWKYGDYVLANLNGCYGYIRKIALEKFQK
jgi:clan AA aspartic protease (TIGR02281 family)